MKTKIGALISAGLIAGTTLAGGATALASTPSAAPNAVAACYLRTDTPNAANDARVGREGCSTAISVTGRIKEERNNFPDDIVGQKTFRGGTSVVYGSCGNGVGLYYSEVSSSSGSFQQGRSVTTCR